MDERERQKTQLIRLADVFMIGPAMIAAGMSRKLSPLMSDFLTVTGALTVVYNGANYLANRTKG